MRRSVESRFFAFLLLALVVPGGCTDLGPAEGPKADFEAATRSGTAPLAVQFTDLSSPGSSPITKWTWWFGDGAKSTQQNPTQVYQEPGTYGVALHVETDVDTDSEYRSLFISVSPRVDPKAEFSGSPRSGTRPLAVQFTDLSASGEGSITGWSWSFGDGGTSIEQNPLHVYATPGVYEVSLSIKDGCGSVTATKAGYVTVQSPCDSAAYSIAEAFVEVRADNDQDGCAERARVHFDANTEDGCVRSVFGMVLLRPEGSAEWPYAFQTACFTITGASAADGNWVQVQNIPLGFYEIRIELYECGGATPVASRDHLEDPDLDNQCFE